MLVIRELAALWMGLTAPSPKRLLAFFFIAAVLVCALYHMSSSRSLLWEVPLQSIAIGLLLAGIPVLVTGLFDNWAVFSSALGFRATVIALLGFVVAWLIRYLQRRHLRRKDA